MKTQNLKLLSVSLFLAGMLSVGISCSKDEGSANEQPIIENEVEIVLEDGISEEELATYQGDIGIVLELRDIQKKGYTPKTIEISVSAESKDFSETIELNQFTLMAQLKLPVQDLSDAAQAELREGVEVIVKVFDESATLILEETISKISFQSNPLPFSIEPSGLEDLNTKVFLKDNTPYYLQILDDGKPSQSSVSINIKPEAKGIITQSSGAKFTGDEEENRYLFQFQSVPDTENSFVIKSLYNNKYLRFFRTYSGTPGSTFMRQPAVVADREIVFPDNAVNGVGPRIYQFIIEKDAENKGVYMMKSVDGDYIRVLSNFGYTINQNVGKLVKFRLIPMNIEWNIENIETQHLEPILPAAKNGFSFNSTLINCGQGGLEQTVGNSKTVETVTSLGWQETLSVSSSHSAGGSLTLGMEVSASFFGNGATYSAEASASYDYTTTSTTDTTNWNEATGSSSETFFSERTITVLPNSASLVYDAFQSYENIKVNVVQRLRVRAKEFTTGEALSGEEISTQFHFNGFEGIITEVGSDFIEVTLRGVANMDNIFKSKSEVQDVAANCGG